MHRSILALKDVFCWVVLFQQEKAMGGCEDLFFLENFFIFLLIDGETLIIDGGF